MSKTTVRTPIVAFASTPEPAGDVVRRKGVIFRAGDYSASHDFVMTTDQLREVPRQFKGPLKLDHGHPTVDGPIDFGVLESVEVSPDGSTLFGTTATPRWLDGALGDARWLVSASFDRATKALRRLSLVTRPRIPDAELQAAFACACGHDTEKEERPMADDDRKARGHALVDSMDDDDLAVMLGDVPVTTDDDEEEEEEDDMETESDKAPYVGDDTAAEFAARDARIAELEAKDRTREAEVFVESAAKDRYVLPWEKPGLIAEHIQAAVDDLGSPAQFSDGKRSSRVQRFRDRILSRKPHDHTEEANFGGHGHRTLSNGGPEAETPEARRARLDNRLKNTPEGLAILARRNGRSA